jgi:L-amino acid N-acyltransferase YncA
VIRHADPGLDGAACAQVYAPYVLESSVSFEYDAPDGAEMARRIELANASYAWLVAELDGRVVGFAYASQHRPRAAYRWDVDVAIYMDRVAHGRGLGRALYEALFELLRHQGIYVAVAGIALPNDASVGLHRALGFVRVGTYERIGYKAGAWRAVEWWQLQRIEAGDETPAEPLGPQRLNPEQRRPQQLG